MNKGKLILIGCIIMQIALIICGIYYVSYFKGVHVILGWFFVLVNSICLGFNINTLARD